MHLPDTVNNLTISDTLGVRLSSRTTVNGTLTLAAGKFTLGSKNLAAVTISGVSSSKYIATDSGGTVTRSRVGAVPNAFPLLGQRLRPLHCGLQILGRSTPLQLPSRRILWEGRKAATDV